MKRLLLCFSLLAINFHISAQVIIEQTVIAAQGGDLSGEVQLQVVVGETIVTQQANSNLSANIGFLQPQFNLVSTEDELNQKLVVSVYPNPCREYVLIETQNEKPLHFEIFTQAGSLVRSGTLTSTNILDVQTLIPGMYHLQVFQDQNHFSTSLFKS